MADRPYAAPEVERIKQRQSEEDNPRLFVGAGTSRVAEPPAVVQRGVAAYARERGVQFSHEGLSTVQQDPGRGHAQFLAYRDAQKAPEAPEARPSYEAMRGEVGRQYEFMTRPAERGGMGLHHEVTEADPYESPAAMMKDVGENRRIKTFSSKTTGGHEFFTDEENDRFRAVHDVFGHAASGRSFSRHGEEAAYRAHSQLFPKEAQTALASETRGQTSYLVATGEFAEQGPGSTLVAMPNWAEGKGKLSPEQFSGKPAAAPRQKQGKLF